MPFQEGHQKVGGKKKGAANKKTLILDTFANAIIEGGMERFQEELKKLKGKDYVYAFITVFEYVKPKLARKEIKVEIPKGLTININKKIV